jgi:O-antigen/teichoic acid export membrane protein
MASELTAGADPNSTSKKAHTVAFFRQSVWMMGASLAGGMLMFLVHKVAKQMPKDQYSLFTTLLQVVTLMGIPGIGVQTIFAQQAASAITEEHERELAGVFRSVLRGIFVLWLVMAGILFLFRAHILSGLKMNNPMALWISVTIGLATMWLPIVMGFLQGHQNFLWLGWTAIVNGAVRFGAMCVIVLVLGGWAAGAMGAVLAGTLAAVALGGWQIRKFWRLESKPVVWREWLARLVPLTFGLGALTFMLSADMIFVRHFFQEETGYYAAAGMIGRALVFFIQPLAAVMFPKIVKSAARAEKSDVLAQALGVTALVGSAAAIACTLFPSLPLRIIYDRSFFAIATPLVPWFAWCMLPLALSTVLVNALLAKAQFKAVPWIAAVAIGYGFALYFHHGTFKTVILTLGVFSSLLLLVCAWFTWGQKVQHPTSKVQG